MNTTDKKRTVKDFKAYLEATNQNKVQTVEMVKRVTTICLITVIIVLTGLLSLTFIWGI